MSNRGQVYFIFCHKSVLLKFSFIGHIIIENGETESCHDANFGVWTTAKKWISWEKNAFSLIKRHSYRQHKTTLVGNKIVDHSNVVEASPVAAAPTTPSIAIRDEKHLSFGIWCISY